MVGPPSLPGGEEAACWPRGDEQAAGSCGAVVSAVFWLKLSLWRGDGAGWWACAAACQGSLRQHGSVLEDSEGCPHEPATTLARDHR